LLTFYIVKEANHQPHLSSPWSLRRGETREGVSKGEAGPEGRVEGQWLTERDLDFLAPASADDEDILDGEDSLAIDGVEIAHDRETTRAGIPEVNTSNGGLWMTTGVSRLYRVYLYIEQGTYIDRVLRGLGLGVEEVALAEVKGSWNSNLATKGVLVAVGLENEGVLRINVLVAAGVGDGIGDNRGEEEGKSSEAKNGLHFDCWEGVGVKR
jgi:hypothetical protein